MNKTSSIWVPVLLIAHLISVLLYLYFPVEIKYSQDVFFSNITYEDFFSIWYFGVEALIVSAFLMISTYEPKTWIEKQFLQTEAAFIFIRGLIYVLHDSHIYETKAKERAMWLFLFILIATFILFKNAWKHGLFNRTNQR